MHSDSLACAEVWSTDEQGRDKASQPWLLTSLWPTALPGRRWESGRFASAVSRWSRALGAVRASPSQRWERVASVKRVASPSVWDMAEAEQRG